MSFASAPFRVLETSDAWRKAVVHVTLFVVWILEQVGNSWIMEQVCHRIDAAQTRIRIAWRSSQFTYDYAALLAERANDTKIAAAFTQYCRAYTRHYNKNRRANLDETQAREKAMLAAGFNPLVTSNGMGDHDDWIFVGYVPL